jgi:hypothetical protein
LDNDPNREREIEATSPRDRVNKTPIRVILELSADNLVAPTFRKPDSEQKQIGRAK